MIVRNYFKTLDGVPVFEHKEFLDGENASDIESGKVRPAFSYKGFADDTEVVPISKEEYRELCRLGAEKIQKEKQDLSLNQMGLVESISKKLKSIGLTDQEISFLTRGR